MNFPYFSAAAVNPDSPQEDDDQVKVSTAEITLKSATLPRRRISHDVRSAPTRESQYTSPFGSAFTRATSLEPREQQQQQAHRPREHYIPIQRPGGGFISNASSQRSVGATLSRQSTNDSESSDTPTASSTTINTQSTSTVTSSQPIKKSPREFIIPIAVEGGGFVTPRASSLEPSEASNNSSNTSFGRLGSRSRKISSIFNDRESEEDSPFGRMNRNTSIGRDTEEDPNSRFTLHRLRSTRPVKKTQSNEANDSGSSGEEDDEDGFEILTAENLFSTLLQRVNKQHEILVHFLINK